jgi:Zn-dependent protease
MNPAELFNLLLLAVPVIIAITLHEAAHGYAARALGDTTAEREGRLSLNPLVHIDPFGTLLLPAVLMLTIGVAFGFAKPVPVNMSELRNPKRDMALVAAAGPLTNIALAIVFAIVLAATSGLADSYPLWRRVMEFGVVLNFVLAILNLYPLPPLDGSKVIAALLPNTLSRYFLRLEPAGFTILLLVFFIIPIVAAQIGYYVDPVGRFLIGPAYSASDWLLALFGAK